jgi:sugar phosphate isomerase/epimerase
MSDETMRERIGVDVGVSEQFTPREAVEWAAENDVKYVDVSLEERGSLHPDEYSEEDVEVVESLREEHGISLGLHTNSATNMAETSPYVDDATDEYMQAYIDIADLFGADRIIVHGGYHFTEDREERTEAAKERLRRAVEYAADKDVELLLENHNFEPDDAEIHYMPVPLDEVVDFFDDLGTTDLSWAFNTPHAFRAEEGIEGYWEEFGPDLCGEIRLNDTKGEKEIHLEPGEGILDFDAQFQLFEESGYDGHYMLAFTDLETMLEGREYLLEQYSGVEA